ncbi:Uncharacterised protein [uncultured archaeon]|nr:Uncharacterised protein [uncultured archaeon]
MFNKKTLTLQEHQKIVGSRFQLAHIIMERTRQLWKGAPALVSVDEIEPEFYIRYHSEVPEHRYPKIALEELRQGKFTWKRLSKEGNIEQEKPKQDYPTAEK